MKGTLFFISLFIITITILQSCGNPVTTVARDDASSATPAPWDLVEEGEDPPATRHSYDLDYPADSASTDSAIAEQPSADEEADEEVAELEVLPADMSRYNPIGRLREVFNDSNKYHYQAGERIGIKPIASVAEAYFTRRPLVKVESCRWYTVEELTHSMPYLVPEAARLLETIGRNFQDSLRSRNLPGHRFRVTSLLRTAHSVKKLRRVNRNATDSSTHQLGTTFDISWSRFDHDGMSQQRASDVELKYVLGEVLRDLRNDNRCLVKYEVKSPCFHITATGK